MTRFRALCLMSAAAAGFACAAGAAEPNAPGAAALDIPSFAEKEPQIAFPTCVGIARIERGAVTEIPVGEGVLWDEQFDMLGDAVGAKVAVLRTASANPVQAVADIRADADTAGLDFVVVYEVAYDDQAETGPTAIEELRVFPTFEGEQTSDPARAAGAAILLDVADGAMYGVASATTIDSEVESLEKGYLPPAGARESAFEAVVVELAHEVETAFVGMMIKAGLPDPGALNLPEDPAEMTQDQIIAQADRQARAAYSEAAPDEGC